MKKIFIILSVALTAAACSGKLNIPDQPEVPASKTFELSANMSSYSGEFLWSPGKAIGIYGSLQGSNAKYVPYNEYLGKGGVIKMYGPEVDGTLYAYFPYSAEGYEAVADGLVPYASVQTYRASAAEHFSENTVLVAQQENGVFDFAIRSGLVKFEVDVDFAGEVKSVVLVSGLNYLSGNFAIDPQADQPVTEGGKTLTVCGMGVQNGKFDVYFALPEGSYETLQLSVHTDAESVSKPVNGVVPVRAGEVTSMTVVDEAYEYTGSDFIIIPEIFD